MKKYSKTSNFYRELKGLFYEENIKRLTNALTINSKYCEQALRVSCKLCGYSLPDTPDLVKHGVRYVFCENCDHLNGFHEDTTQFARFVYTDDGGKNYSKFYMDSNYLKRIENIYLPKVDFLLESLPEGERSIFDFGCGLGHFVDACRIRGIEATGADVSKELVQHANDNIENKYGVRPIILSSISDGYSLIESTEANVISALAVMEHLVDLDEFIKAVKNSSAEYFYYSVPTYGLNVAFETIFDDVFPRHLSSGHTHLFTETSRKKLEQLLHVEPIAEWRFGTDMRDLQRSIEIELVSRKVSQKYLKRVQLEFDRCIDELQSIIDTNHICSQVHVVCKRK